MSVRLTDTWLRNTVGKPQTKDFEKGEANGFGVRVRKSGAVSFIFRPVLATGEQIKMTLGRYPTMSLKEARETADKYRKIVDDGFDPRVSKAAEVYAHSQERTLEDVFMFWYTNFAVKNKTNSKLHLRSFELHIQKKYGGIYYKDVPRAEFIQDLMALAAIKPAVTDRVITDLRGAIDYARTNHFIEHPNFLTGVRRKHVGIVKGVRERVFDENDLLLFFVAVNNCSICVKNKVFLKLLLYYGCRGGELRQTKTDWLNFEAGEWTVPVSHTKTRKKVKRPIVRPITETVRPLWEAALSMSGNTDSVFTTMANRADMTDNPMTVGAVLGLPFTLQRWVSRNLKGADGKPYVWEHWSNHDLRRTARTMWQGEWSVMERMLGHVLPGETDVYDKRKSVEAMLPVYEQWWAYLAEVEARAMSGLGFTRVWAG